VNSARYASATCSISEEKRVIAKHTTNGTSAAETAFAASHYANPYVNPEAHEWETGAASQSNPYSNSELGEWEAHEAAHALSPEAEEEGEFFFRRGLQRLVRVAAPYARLLAPLAARTLVGMIPGYGVAGPPASRLVGALLREGAQAAIQLEAEFFGTNEAEAEVGQSEAAQEAALMEVLAAEASHSESESEAAALVGAALPIGLRALGASRSLRYIIPTLVFANARLVRLLHRRGPAGRRLLRLVPTVLRWTIASLGAAQRAGRSVTPALALQIMAGHAARILGTPRLCVRVIVRNAVIRQRTVAPGGAI
jgi:hypothetical protein